MNEMYEAVVDHATDPRYGHSAPGKPAGQDIAADIAPPADVAAYSAMKMISSALP